VTAPATILILIVTGVVTFIAFQNPTIRERLIFNPREILQHNQYERMLTSALIHGDWMHFAFNAYSLYSFGQAVEEIYGAKTLLLIYLSSILGGSILSLIIHRRDEYRALGASGGVCGVIFASIFLLPGSSIQIFLIPVDIPAYVYAIGFLVISFIGQQRQIGRIGHDAHLGGAIVGLLVAVALYPQAVEAAPWMFAAVLGLSLIILLILIFNPAHLLKTRFDSTASSPGNGRAREYDESHQRNEKKAEVDRLLDKVSREGVGALSDSERKTLDDLSREIYGRK